MIRLFVVFVLFISACGQSADRLKHEEQPLAVATVSKSTPAESTGTRATLIRDPQPIAGVVHDLRNRRKLGRISIRFTIDRYGDIGKCEADGVDLDERDKATLCTSIRQRRYSTPSEVDATIEFPAPALR